MYNVTFHYFNNEPDVPCYNITEIAFDTDAGTGMKVVSGEDILKHNFKKHSFIVLHSDVSNYFVSCESLMCFEIKKV